MGTTSGGSIFRRLRARRLSDSIRAEFPRPPVADDHAGSLQTVVVGLDPLRVLLFGSGPLIGYGVRARREAVDGALAELLAEQTGRGVIVESRVRLSLTPREAVRSLGGAGTATFDVAIWAPKFGEELHHSRSERYRSSVHEMLQEFRAQSRIPLVLCHLPKPLGFDWRTLMRRPRVTEINTVLTEEARTVPDCVAVPVGPYRPSEITRTLWPVWHRRLAEALLPAVLNATGVRASVLPAHGTVS